MVLIKQNLKFIKLIKLDKIVLKIFNTNEFESVSENKVPNNVATVNLEQSNKFVHIEFNKSQTHLIALVQNFKTEQDFEYFLNVYALESIKLDVTNSNQVLKLFILNFLTIIQR